MWDTSDTIAAIATARGGALRGIVRVSGPAAISCLEKILSPPTGIDPSATSVPEQVPEQTVRSNVADRSDGSSSGRIPHVISGMLTTPPPIGPVPCDVYLWPTARSYTRQPCFEVHTFGSPPILDATLSAICQAGARVAQPGEFTLRAFLAGRLDLTQAEAVLGVIDARDSDELDVALQQLAGGLVRPLHELRDRLLDVLARLEAGLDFVEEDIEFVEAAEVQIELERALTQISELHEQIANRTHEVASARAVLRGWPNVGKSSLFNALVKKETAIVSAQSGTTRDYVTRSVDFQGMRIQFFDTAGIEFAAAGIANAAQQVASQQSHRATLQLLCLDGTRPLNDWERDELNRENGTRLIVITKADLPQRCQFDGPAIRTSSRTLAGIDDLCRAIQCELERVRPVGFCIDSTAARCEESLRLAAESLRHASEVLASDQGEELIASELIASELRLALDELGQVAGTVYTDDILDRIFSRFCIGK